MHLGDDGLFIKCLSVGLRRMNEKIDSDRIAAQNGVNNTIKGVQQSRSRSKKQKRRKPMSKALKQNSSSVAQKVVEEVKKDNPDQNELVLTPTQSELLKQLLSSLEETNKQLFRRIVYFTEQDLCRDILDETLRIHESGGLETTDEARQRSKGGIFIILLKTRLPDASIRNIWHEQRLQHSQRRKWLKKNRKMKSLAANKRECNGRAVNSGEFNSSEFNSSQSAEGSSLFRDLKMCQMVQKEKAR